jgi:hypothetical protein
MADVNFLANIMAHAIIPDQLFLISDEDTIRLTAGFIVDSTTLVICNVRA